MASAGEDGGPKVANELSPDETKIASGACYTLEVLRIVKEAQLQHGLRHGDYQRYRQYCSRRIRRTRKALHFPQGTKHKVQPKKITTELVKDSRYLLLPLIDAERAWAYAMQLKSEANTEPRKRFHLISRLRKAVQHAETLDRLCNESGVFDARTKLEVQAYSSWMKGVFDFELELWKKAIENFSQAKTIYEKLAEAVSDDAKDIYLQRCGEISPNIRYCAYNIGDESAMEDLMRMRMKIGQEDPLTSRLDELIEKTRERQAETFSEITWCGRVVPVKNERVRVALLSIQQNAKQLSESGSSAEQKLSLYESLLKELIDAQQSLRDELKDDQVFKAMSRGQQPPADAKVPSAVHLHTYLAYLRQTYTVERNLLLIESLKASKQADGKKNKPQDFARLYDIIVQNLSELLHLPGIEEQAALSHDVNAQIIGYKAFKCFYIAQSYLSVRKWKETLALYERALDYCRQALDKYAKSQLESAKKAKDIQALSDLVKTVDGQKYSVQASSILDSHDVADQPAAVSNATILAKPLVERLEEYVEDPSLTSKKPNLIKFPPDFEPIPAKPLFFDVALSLVQFPSLEDKMEQKPQAGGFTGYFKGWLWGGKK